MTKKSEPKCVKCNGTGSYAYDENHGKICEACCPHDQGWFQLTEHYETKNGKWACRRGCGELRDEPHNLKQPRKSKP